MELIYRYIMIPESMHFRLESMSDQLSELGVFILDNAFNEATLRSLMIYYQNHVDNLRPAGIGQKSSTVVDQHLRSDHIYWVDENHESLKAFNEMIRSVTNRLKQELFLPIRRTETQMALYQEGSFYTRHQDRHKNTDYRWITLVLYLNEGWMPNDGGQLSIYFNESKKEKVMTIEPLMNRIVIFKSELEHEVHLSFKDRMSYTTWFRDDLL